MTSPNRPQGGLDDSADSDQWSGKKRLEVGIRVAKKGLLPAVELTVEQAEEIVLALSANARDAEKLRLSDYINAASINASDSPHIVVEKLQAAIDAATKREGG